MQSNLQEATTKLKLLFKTTKPIIIIGGVAGSGKTTTGNLLLHELDLDHKLATGWIREILTSTTSKDKVPELFGHSFRSIDKNLTPFQHFTKLSEILLPAIEKCINRARREGQSLLIEGPMMIPGILKPEMYDMFICLKKPENADDHLKALTTDTHTKRKMTMEDIPPNVEIENELLKICKNFKVPVIPFIDKEKRKDMILNEMANKFLKNETEAIQ